MAIKEQTQPLSPGDLGVFSTYSVMLLHPHHPESPVMIAPAVTTHPRAVLMILLPEGWKLQLRMMYSRWRHFPTGGAPGLLAQ